MMTRLGLAAVLIMAAVLASLAQPPPFLDQLSWRSTMVGMGWQLYRGNRLTGWTIARDDEAHVWRLYRDGVLIGVDVDPEPLKATGAAAAPP
jgi:hypothetical protein